MLFKHIVFDHDGTLVSNRVIFDGVETMLKNLFNKGIKLYVWTARDRHSTLQSLKSHGILKYFEDISTSTDAQPKPSSQGILNMLGDVEGSTVCVVGDSSSDMIGAKSFKAYAVGVVWQDSSSQYEEYLSRSGADRVFKDVNSCEEFLVNKV